MNKLDLLKDAVDKYKTEPFEILVEKAKKKDVISLIAKDREGRNYQIEINFYFEDRTQATVRVSGIIDEDPSAWWKMLSSKPSFGFLAHKDGTIE